MEGVLQAVGLHCGDEQGLYLAHFVPFAEAVTADRPHVYFISRGGCLVSLPPMSLAHRERPAVWRPNEFPVAALLPPRYQSSACQIKASPRESAERSKNGGGGALKTAVKESRRAWGMERTPQRAPSCSLVHLTQ